MYGKDIEQKATELFLTRHGITAEEFAENETVLKDTLGYNQCVCYFRLLEVGKALTTLFQTTCEGLKDLALKFFNIQENVEKKKVLRSTWKVKRNTTVKSQVINNKPKNMVRKIIR